MTTEVTQSATVATDINITLSKKERHIVFTQTVYDEDGFETDRKIGFLAIKEDRDPEEMLALAQERDWEFVGEPDENGITKVRKV